MSASAVGSIDRRGLSLKATLVAMVVAGLSLLGMGALLCHYLAEEEI